MEYTEAQRSEALELYAEHGAAEAARRLTFEVSAGTIRVWAHRAGMSRYSAEKTEAATQASQRRQAELREEVRETFLAKAMDLLLRIDEPHFDYRGPDAVKVTWDKAPASAVQSYMTAAGIALDKYRLEMGEATSRTYHEGADDIDRRVAQLVAEMESRSKAGSG